jgi:hypothetical protein
MNGPVQGWEKNKMCLADYITIVLVFVLVLFTSGPVIRLVLRSVVHKNLEEVAEADHPAELEKRLDIGQIIGKCENIIILCFIILEAYTAIGLVVTAKTIVRKEEIEKNSMYFLAGTLINVSYSVLMGFILRTVLEHVGC